MRQPRSEGAPDGDDSPPIVYEPSGDGVVVVDTVERQRQPIEASRVVDPTPAPTAPFTHPVDAAVSFRTAYLALPRVQSLFVHRETGTRENVEIGESVTLDGGDHVVEFDYLFKIYLSFSGRAFAEVTEEGVRVDLPGEATVSIGARSRHDRPAATITTTSDPVDVMQAVTALGSALKTTSPERSFPTLRGHPPLIELGDELDIPDSIRRPTTGVTIQVPADYRSVYVAAPLAFYLGASLEPAPEPALIAGDTVHELGSGDEFEDAVERTLKHLFTMDCLTRTEGMYPVFLYERAAVEEAVDLDFESLYDASLVERIETYLDVPFEVIEPHVPDWKQVTHISPTPEQVELLPFLVDDLAIVKSPQTHSVGDSTVRADAVNEFMRNTEGAFTRGETSASDAPTTVRPAETDAVEQSWVGDGAPLGASKPVVEAFENGLSRGASEGPVTITVVCNESEMSSESDLLDSIYGNRDSLPFDVVVHRDLATSELESVLAQPADFFHFIGHIDGEGFKCHDGVLRGSDLSSVAVDAFFLNACQSYETALSLIEHGAIAGVATVRDVVNRGAEQLGVSIARLLDLGFSMNGALDVARGESVMSSRYVVVGNGGHAVTQSESGAPNVSTIERDGDQFEVTFETYPQDRNGMGAIVRPNVGTSDQYYLCSGEIQTFTMSAPELETFLSLSQMPVRVDGELRWSEEIDVADFETMDQ